MCFSLSCLNLNSEQLQLQPTDLNINLNTNNSIVLKGYGRTIRYKTNVPTIWKDIKIVYKPSLGTIDGIGISVFNRKEYMFLLLGNIEQTTTNQVIFKIRKVHPGINDITNSNSIEYTGIYSNSSEEKGVIYLVSHQSSGYLMLKMEIH